MTIITSREGRLCIDGKRIPVPSIFIEVPEGFGENGDLSLPATQKNVLAISQLFMDTFIIQMGMTLDSGVSPEGYPGLDIVKKYDQKDDVLVDSGKFLERFRRYFRNPKNLTKGWCYLSSATLHRFFYKEFDLYRNECSLDEDDFHWWLQNENGDIIDLTEEQYRIFKIYNPRENGRKKSPMGQSYAVKTRNMSVVIANRITEKELYMCEFPATSKYRQN